MDCFSEMAEQYAALLTSRMNIRTSREMDRTLCNEVFALRFLLQHGAAHPRELSDVLMVSTARTAVILNGLERKGLIARTRDDADCRQKTVELTQRGRDSLEQRYRRLTAFFAEGFRYLGAHDTQEFLRLYERLFEIFDELNEHTEKKGV